MLVTATQRGWRKRLEEAVLAGDGLATRLWTATDGCRFNSKSVRYFGRLFADRGWWVVLRTLWSGVGDGA